MANGPARGELRLLSSARPALAAGEYQFELQQTIHEGDPNNPVGNEQVTRFVDVTAPRFNLPGSEVQSVFPPANATGAFQTRLPQIALRRRTLPWERAADQSPQASRPPWLALVVLADGEANFLSGVSIADAMPADVRSNLGVTETGTCDALEVSSIVVEKVFPHRDELDYLCHVRQINLEDTELAGTDDDGFLSVVLSNRLPSSGQRYGAYLISLEGQLHELPTRPTTPPVETLGPSKVYQESDAVLQAASYSARPGSTIDLVATEQPQSTTTAAATSSWQAPVSGSPVAEPLPVASSNQGFLRHDIDFRALHQAIQLPTPRLLRFPVLAHWSFACSTTGDFQSLMAGLDVGLLGTAPEPEQGRAPTTLKVADTGHTVVDRLTRRGEPADAWYRGPFTPREVARRAALHPYHVADQARRLADDGREDISEAAAFELGRLLALSDPAFAATLLEWRRAAVLAERLLEAATRVPGVGNLEPVEGGLARSLGVNLLTDVSTPVPAAAATPGGAAAAARTPLGPRVKLNDLEGLLQADDAAVIADGLGVAIALVEEILSPEITQAGLPRDSFRNELPLEFDDVVARKETLFHLQKHLDQVRDRLLDEGGVAPEERWHPRPPTPGGGAVRPDRGPGGRPGQGRGGRRDVVEELWPGLKKRLEEGT